MNSRNDFPLLMRVAILAMAALLFESTLTRLLAVAQFYHFAFLVVSLALMGFGASGTLLSIFPVLHRVPMDKMLSFAGVGFAFGVAIAYAGVNWLPFDSYSIAWERRQILFFILYYLALTIPFLVSGLGIGAALSTSNGKSHLIYAANLVGSALGALFAPVVISGSGVPGAVLMSACLGLIAAWIGIFKVLPLYFWDKPVERGKSWNWLFGAVLGLGVLTFGGVVAMNKDYIAPMGMKISPYKGLAYARQYPGAELVFGRWSDVSRVDVVASAGTRRLPGLSYQYTESLPLQAGLSVDGDALQPITLSSVQEFAAASWMPEALVFELHPDADVLVIEPGGGLGILQALAGNANMVTAVLDNKLIVDSVANALPAYDIYSNEQVNLIEGSARSYLHRPGQDFDLVVFPLSDAYRPVTSGAYSLAESYLLTVEALYDALGRLKPGGVLVVTRWLQSPPSESLRLIATLIEALKNQGGSSADDSILAYRSIQTMTVLVRPEGWMSSELDAARQFMESRRFDWVWAPDLQGSEANLFNRLPEPEYYQLVREMLSVSDRQAFYEQYAYKISPTHDDQPFFFHFFTRGQTAEVLQSIGHTWQPFGGSGYLILFALLALVFLLSFVMIFLPLAWKQKLPGVARSKPKSRMRIFAYFSLLGVAFLFVEIPLIQQFILVLGQPIYSFAVVVASLLTFSGVGSLLARKSPVHIWQVITMLAGLVVLMVLVKDKFVPWIIPWPLWGRVVAVILMLAPMGLLMGMPFPRGLIWLEGEAPQLRAWAWAINGCSSVIASVLAAILTLSYGFGLVMLLGAVAYLGAGSVFDY